MRRLIKQLKRLIGADGKRMICPMLCSAADAVCNSFLYGVMLFLLLDLVNDTLNHQKLVTYIIILTCVFLLRCVFQAVGFTAAQRTGPDVSYQLRMDMGNHIRTLNLGFFNKNSIGRLTGALLTDVTDFETIITHCLCDIIKVLSFTVLSIVMSFLLDWRFGIAVAVLVGIAFPFLLRSGAVAARNSDHLRSAKQNVVSRIVEYITGMRTFRLYNLIGTRFVRLDDSLNDLRRESTRAELSVLPLAMAFSTITSMIVPTALLLGTWLLIGDAVDAAAFLLILLLSVAISSNMTVASSLYPQVRSIAKAADSIISILNEKELPYKETEPTFSDYAVEFKNVTFGYDNEQPVLEKLSFQAAAGTTTALIGPSGSGKTTVASLISRFWDVDSGEILLGGKNIRNIHPDTLAGKLSVVFQEVYLLCDTVYNNIKIGKPDATREEIETAAKAANCHDFIMKWEKGYDTAVGEGGSTLSGGEKQRIAIARALLRNAPIVLLDETTSSLDADNEREIQQAFDRLMRGKTVLVIAHRLKTIMGADNIIVLNKGQIAETGSHEMLIKQAGWYAQMIEQQKKAEQWSVK